MKPSIARSLKTLASKIHPPLPLNPQESQRLLAILTESFRNQLDREHPTPDSSSAVTGSGSRPQPADAHIQSVLRSPLLQKRTNTTSFKRDAASTSQITGVLDKVQSSLSAPMEYFRDQVAAGQASVDTARYCLVTHLRNITTYRDDKGRSSETAKKEAWADSKAGGQVLDWLWATGLEDSMEFMYNKNFVWLLTAFMVAEGKEPRLQSWLRKLGQMLSQSTSTAAQEELANRTGHLLRAYVWWRAHHEPSDYESTVTLLNQATKLFTSQNGLPEKIVSEILQPAGTQLSYLLIQQEAIPEISPSAFRELLASRPLWCSDSSLAAARFALLDPSSRNPGPAYRWIRANAIAARERYQQQHLSRKQRVALVWLCVHTSRTLISQGKEEKALELMEFVRREFARELGERGLDKRSTLSKKLEREKRRSLDARLTGLALD